MRSAASRGWGLGFCALNSCHVERQEPTRYRVAVLTPSGRSVDTPHVKVLATHWPLNSEKGLEL
jgi:hypothetical protein